MRTPGGIVGITTTTIMFSIMIIVLRIRWQPRWSIKPCQVCQSARAAVKISGIIVSSE